MDPWSNIVVLPEDPEISEIDKFETSLGTIPINARHIRDLITGFEVCHYKYKKHIDYIKTSILTLRPNIKLKEIGSYHIKKGDQAWRGDKTGRSLTGQKYIWAINNWLGEMADEGAHTEYDAHNTIKRVGKWLGIRNQEKERIVRLLKARLLWDWKSYEEFLGGDEDNILEYQVCRMDICHYAFPENMDRMIRAIGQMKPVESFEGCGSYNEEIKDYIKEEISEIHNMIDSWKTGKLSDKKDKVKRWLFACMAKTLKEQVGFSMPINIF
jgi:hypothetical protein